MGYEAAFVMLGCTGILLAVVLVVAVFFHITLMNALQACAFRNQKMPPGLVWLRFVPVLNIVWPFVNVIQVGNSLRAEYCDRGLRPADKSFGEPLGICYYAVVLLGSAFNFGGLWLVRSSDSTEPAGYFVGLSVILDLVRLLLFALYWGQMAEYVRELNLHGKPDDRYDFNPDTDRPRQLEGDDQHRIADSPLYPHT